MRDGWRHDAKQIPSRVRLRWQRLRKHRSAANCINERKRTGVKQYIVCLQCFFSSQNEFILSKNSHRTVPADGTHGWCHLEIAHSIDCQRKWSCQFDLYVLYITWTAGRQEPWISSFTHHTTKQPVSCWRDNKQQFNRKGFKWLTLSYMRTRHQHRLREIKIWLDGQCSYK